MDDQTDLLFPGIDHEEEACVKRRETCGKCRRPITVCWCPFLPHPPLEVCSKVCILQHPYEDKRCLSTTPMLTFGLKPETVTLLKGSRFNLDKYPELLSLLESPYTVLLYPDSNSVDIESLPTDQTYNLIVLDGTWLQAKAIYSKNKFLHGIKKVKVTKPPLSKYVVRTQPTDECLSTVESVALALQLLEKKNDLFECLTKPLTALCEFQLHHGAVPHQSKEYLIKNGLYKSQRSTPKS